MPKDGNRLRAKFDGGHAAFGAIGLIVLETDETLEPELAQAFHTTDATLYHSRIPFDPVVAPETLAAMATTIPKAAGLLPQAASFQAVGYGCTSAATVIGPARVQGLIASATQTASVTEPISAALAAFAALGARKIGFLTPYRADVSARMRTLFEKSGLEITSFASFEEEEDAKVARISEACVLDGIRHVGDAHCDLVFSACTNLRSFGIITKAEQLLGKPVISSNSALAWHLGKLTGTRPNGPGQLFR